MMSEIDRELEDLIEKFDQYPESRAFAPLADAYRKRGELDKAVAICEKGLERYPGYASARVILGKCFYDKGATERARSEFLQVLETDSENMVALKYMGDISLAEDKQSEAADYFRRLLEIDPTNEKAKAALGRIESGLKSREIDLEDDESVKNVQQPGELATITLAGIYAAQGYYQKALEVYRKILERDPGNNEASRMVEKINRILDSSEQQRDEAFQQDVMTISLDDVEQDLAKSTRGKGGKEDEEDESGEEKRGPDDQQGEEPESGEEVSEAVKEMEREDRGEEEDKDWRGDETEEEDEQRDDMDHFKSWVEKLRDKQNDDH